MEKNKVEKAQPSETGKTTEEEFFGKKIKRFLKGIKFRIFPKSLLLRFFLILFFPLMLLQVVMSAFFFDNHWDTISRRLASSIVGEIETAVQVYERYPNNAETGFLLKQLSLHLQMEISFEPGEKLQYPLPKSKNSMMVSALRRSLNNTRMPYWIDEFEDGKYVQISIEAKKGVFTVRVPSKRFFSSTIYVFLLWMIGSSLLLFIIAFVFMKNQIRPMSRLSKAASEFGMGREAKDFKPEGALEVRQAGEAFLDMKNRIQRYLNERTRMLAGISHDLRTPLTRMKLQLSMMEYDGIQGIDELLSDIDEMEHMIEGYLSFTKGEGRESTVSVEAGELLKDLVQKLRRNGQVIDLHIEGKQFLCVRPREITRAIMNILTNAGRYAKTASVRAGARIGYYEIIVDDDGPGISKDDREAVFRAFYRLDDSRNTKTGGVGLGLTIARDTIFSHGGDILLEDSPLGGLRVRIRIPF